MYLFTSYKHDLRKNLFNVLATCFLSFEMILLYHFFAFHFLLIPIFLLAFLLFLKIL